MVPIGTMTPWIRALAESADVALPAHRWQADTCC
jgi:hypothetical protein